MAPKAICLAKKENQTNKQTGKQKENHKNEEEKKKKKNK